MSKQISVSLKEELNKLKRDLEALAPALEKAADEAIVNVAHAAHAAIVSKAQRELHSTRHDYLKGLQFETLSENEFLIYLDGKYPNDLENGYGPFDMKPGMLASKKIVGVGRRAGQPWVQVSIPRKNNPAHKYAYVPLERQPHSKAPKGANMADAIKAMTAKNLEGFDQKLTKIFRDGEGNPIQGLAAIGKSEDPKLDNLVKYQKTYSNAQGKSVTQSVYINYRLVSEKGGGWLHPGHSGIHAFSDAEKEVQEQIQKIISSFM